MALTNRYKTAPGRGHARRARARPGLRQPLVCRLGPDNTDPDTAGGWFLRLLAWPAWRFDSDDSIQDVFATDLRAILVVVLTALFLFLLPGSQLARARGTLSQFFAGWASYVFAGAFAALLTALIRSNPSLLGAFQAAGSGATYGFFVGWIIGIATLGGWRGRR